MLVRKHSYWMHSVSGPQIKLSIFISTTFGPRCGWIQFGPGIVATNFRWMTGEPHEPSTNGQSQAHKCMQYRCDSLVLVADDVVTAMKFVYCSEAASWLWCVSCAALPDAAPSYTLHSAKKNTKSAIFDLPNTSYSPVSKHVHDGDYAQSFSVYTTHSMRTVSYSVHNNHDQFNRFIRLHYFFFSLCHPKSFL